MEMESIKQSLDASKALLEKMDAGHRENLVLELRHAKERLELARKRLALASAEAGSARDNEQACAHAVDNARLKLLDHAELSDLGDSVWLHRT